MKISEDVRQYARDNGYDDNEAISKGKAEKAKEFIDSGAEVYTIGQKDENNTFNDEKKELADKAMLRDLLMKLACLS